MVENQNLGVTSERQTQKSFSSFCNSAYDFFFLHKKEQQPLSMVTTEGSHHKKMMNLESVCSYINHFILYSLVIYFIRGLMMKQFYMNARG